MISFYGSLLQIEGLVSIPCVICSCLTNCQREDTRRSYGCMSVTDRVSAILFGDSGHN